MTEKECSTNIFNIIVRKTKNIYINMSQKDFWKGLQKIGCFAALGSLIFFVFGQAWLAFTYPRFSKQKVLAAICLDYSLDGLENPQTYFILYMRFSSGWLISPLKETYPSRLILSDGPDRKKLITMELYDHFKWTEIHLPDIRDKVSNQMVDFKENEALFTAADSVDNGKGKFILPLKFPIPTENLFKYLFRPFLGSHTDRILIYKPCKSAQLDVKKLSTYCWFKLEGEAVKNKWFRYFHNNLVYSGTPTIAYMNDRSVVKYSMKPIVKAYMQYLPQATLDSIMVETISSLDAIPREAPDVTLSGLYTRYLRAVLLNDHQAFMASETNIAMLVQMTEDELYELLCCSLQIARTNQSAKLLNDEFVDFAANQFPNNPKLNIILGVNYCFTGDLIRSLEHFDRVKQEHTSKLFYMAQYNKALVLTYTCIQKEGDEGLCESSNVIFKRLVKEDIFYNQRDRIYFLMAINADVTGDKELRKEYTDMINVDSEYYATLVRMPQTKEKIRIDSYFLYNYD